MKLDVNSYYLHYPMDHDCAIHHCLGKGSSEHSLPTGSSWDSGKTPQVAENLGMGDAPPSYRSQVSLSPVLSQQQCQEQRAALPLLFTEFWTVDVPKALCKTVCGL